jgi:hypothetical protein
LSKRIASCLRKSAKLQYLEFMRLKSGYNRNFTPPSLKPRALAAGLRGHKVARNARPRRRYQSAFMPMLWFAALQAQGPPWEGRIQIRSPPLLTAGSRDSVKVPPGNSLTARLAGKEREHRQSWHGISGLLLKLEEAIRIVLSRFDMSAPKPSYTALCACTISYAELGHVGLCLSVTKSRVRVLLSGRSDVAGGHNHNQGRCTYR